MAKQGGVYFIPTFLPPNQKDNHRVLVLTNSKIQGRYSHPSQRFFINVAIIRSAIKQNGEKLPIVPGWQYPVNLAEYPTLVKHDSVIETHQIFHVPYQEFSDKNTQYLGDIDNNLLEKVLASVNQLFSI